MQIQLRDYQLQGIEQIRNAFIRGRRSVLYSLPTGGGKTVVFCYVTENAVKKSNRVFILVHRTELIDQTSEALDALGVDYGLIAPGQPENPDRPVQICSVQSLVRRLDRWRGCADLIVIDEAHHAVAGSWRKVLEAFPEARRLGVSATPERLDGKGLADQFDELVVGPGVMELTQAGYLSPARVFAPPAQVQVRGLRRIAGDYRKGELAEAASDVRLMGDVVDHYKRLLAPATAIAFCVTVEHAKLVCNSFRDAGVRAEVIDGTLSRTERRRMIRGLATGDVQVLCSCEVISEGTDVPTVGGALLLRPTLSLSLYLQQVGRCLRPAEGKTEAIVLDHAGNVQMHGLPQQIRFWSLEGSEEREKKTPERAAPIVRVCPDCFSACPGSDSICPFCGAELVKSKKPPAAGIGELEEVHFDHAKEMRRAEAEERMLKRDRHRQVGRARTLQQLKALAEERGYSPGWAYHVYTSRRRRGAQL